MINYLCNHILWISFKNFNSSIRSRYSNSPGIHNSLCPNPFRYKVPLYSNAFQYAAVIHCTRKWSFTIKDFFSKCDQVPADLVTFTEEILNKKLILLYSDCTEHLQGLKQTCTLLRKEFGSKRMLLHIILNT